MAMMLILFDSPKMILIWMNSISGSDCFDAGTALTATLCLTNIEISPPLRSFILQWYPLYPSVKSELSFKNPVSLGTIT